MATNIFSWNVNGIRAIEKKGFLNWLSLTSPDILCLQETKAHPSQLSPSLLHEHGYHTAWHSAAKAGYSSVATFCKVPPLETQYGLGIERFDCEGRVLVTEHPGFCLYNVYFPNGRDGERVDFKLDFYAALYQQVAQRLRQGQAVIITGDWNTAHTEIDLAQPDKHQDTTGFLPEERAALEVYFEGGLVDIFRQLNPDATKRYTWWSYNPPWSRKQNLGWRIDYFMVSPHLLAQVKDAAIFEKPTEVEKYGSDHCPISLTLATQ